MDLGPRACGAPRRVPNAPAPDRQFLRTFCPLPQPPASSATMAFLARSVVRAVPRVAVRSFAAEAGAAAQVQVSPAVAARGGARPNVRRGGVAARRKRDRVAGRRARAAGHHRVHRPRRCAWRPPLAARAAPALCPCGTSTAPPLRGASPAAPVRALRRPQRPHATPAPCLLARLPPHPADVLGPQGGDGPHRPGAYGRQPGTVMPRPRVGMGGETGSGHHRAATPFGKGAVSPLRRWCAPALGVSRNLVQPEHGAQRPGRRRYAT